jgi:hypothetical protein
MGVVSKSQPSMIENLFNLRRICMANNVIVDLHSDGRTYIIVTFFLKNRRGVEKTELYPFPGPFIALEVVQSFRQDPIGEKISDQDLDEVLEKLLILRFMTCFEGTSITPLQFEELYGKYPFEVTLEMRESMRGKLRNSDWSEFPYQFNKLKRTHGDH